MYGGNLKTHELPEVKEFKTKEGNHFTQILNIDYKKFKLFLLSILWRAHISSNSFFSDVDLGPHGERLRAMIYDSDPGDDTEYPILMLSVARDRSMPEIITQPARRKTQSGHRNFTFVMNNIFYVYFVGAKDHMAPDYALHHTINALNEMRILHIPAGSEKKFLTNHFDLGVNDVHMP